MKGVHILIPYTLTSSMPVRLMFLLLRTFQRCM